jgi:RNA polymerase sigma factor (sigma-70 family)
VQSRIRDQHDAEETTADAFIEAWKSLPGLRNPAGFRPWLFRIAWTRVLRWYGAHGAGSRGAKARGMITTLSPVEMELLEEQTAYAPLAVQEDLREAMNDLLPDDLHLLLEKYDARLSYKEIAERDGIAVSTVRDRLVAARDRLSKVLQRAGLYEQFAREMEERRRNRHPDGPDVGPDVGPDLGPDVGPDSGPDFGKGDSRE